MSPQYSRHLLSVFVSLSNPTVPTSSNWNLTDLKGVFTGESHESSYMYMSLQETKQQKIINTYIYIHIIYIYYIIYT